MRPHRCGGAGPGAGGGGLRAQARHGSQCTEVTFYAHLPPAPRDSGSPWAPENAPSSQRRKPGRPTDASEPEAEARPAQAGPPGPPSIPARWKRMLMGGRRLPVTLDASRPSSPAAAPAPPQFPSLSVSRWGNPVSPAAWVQAPGHRAGSGGPKAVGRVKGAEMQGGPRGAARLARCRRCSWEAAAAGGSDLCLGVPSPPHTSVPGNQIPQDAKPSDACNSLANARLN